MHRSHVGIGSAGIGAMLLSLCLASPALAQTKADNTKVNKPDELSAGAQKNDKPAGKLVLDDEQLRRDHVAHNFPGTYYRLASDPKALFGHKPPGGQSGWGEGLRKSRYVWAFQSRRSRRATARQ